MVVAIPFTSDLQALQVEHRTTDTNIPGVDAATTHHLDIPQRRPSRLVRVRGQAVNGNGGAGEFHCLYKVVPPYGTWHSIDATLGEALSLDEVDSIVLNAKGAAAASGIVAGSILRITGIVAGDTPDRVVTRVVRVTAVILHATSADEIDVVPIWTSLNPAMDTGATLELYDTSHVDGSYLTEDIWHDVSPDALFDEALTAGETAITLQAEGAAAAAGIEPGSIIRATATGTVSTDPEQEIMLVTAITLVGASPDVLTVVRGYWGTTDLGLDDDNTVLEVLEGRITDLKALSGSNDNVQYQQASLDDDFADLDGRSVLRSIVAGTAEVRVSALLVPYGVN